MHVANGFSPEARVLASVFAHRQSMDVLVLHHHWSGDPESANRFADTGHVTVTRVDFGWRPPPLGLLRKASGRVKFQLSRAVALRAARSYAPDIIISSQQVWDCTMATYLARRLGTKQVIQLHYAVGWWLGKLPLARLQTCDEVIAISDFIAEQAIAHGVPRHRVTTIKNTTLPLVPPEITVREDVRAELGLPHNACVVGFVARLDPFKGHAEAIEAFTRMASTRPHVHFVIAGRGELEPTLKDQAAGTPVAERIHFLGFRTDVPRLLAGMDLFIHPSYNEPFGLAVLEAQAAGLPVLAFRSGATPEIVRHGETGLLAGEGSVEELADLLADLVDDADSRKRMGAAARESVAREFSPMAASMQFETVLHTALGK